MPLRTSLLLATALAAGCGGGPETFSLAAVSRTVMVLDVPVHVLEAGPADAPSVLLLHGGKYAASTWEELGTLALLAACDRRAVAIDLPGFGETPAAGIEAVAFLDGVCNALELDRPVLVSPSMSGRFGLPFAARRSARLAGYVPIAPANVFVIQDELGAADAPALVVWGDRDETFPVAGAESLAALMPNAQVAVIADAGHACYLDQPEPFHAALLEFLDRVQPRSP